MRQKEKIESINQVITNTPQLEIAKSLGLKAYALDAPDIQKFRLLLVEVNECVHSWPELEGHEFAEHMLAHGKEVNDIFDSYPLAWRFPVYMERDIYFLYHENMGEDGRRIFKNIMNAWQWYAFFRAKKSELAFFKTANIFDGNPIQAQNYLNNAIRGTWGSMQGTWIESLGLGSQVDYYKKVNEEAVRHFVDSMSSPNTTVFRRELGNTIESPDLSFEILFIYNECYGARPETYVPQLNFLLCQTQMFAYKDIVTYSTSETAYAILPVWCHWVGRYFPELMSHDSIQRTLFDFAFGLDGSPLMKDRKVRPRHKRKVGGLVGLPPVVVRTLESCYPEYRQTASNVHRRMQRVAEEISALMVLSPGEANGRPSVSQPAISQISPKTLKKIPKPHASSLFIRGDDKKQLRQLDLRDKFPEGTTVLFERQLPKSKTFESLEVRTGVLNDIPSVYGRSIAGRFTYRLTILLPSGHTFPDGKTKAVLEESFYAEAEPTTEEKETSKLQKKTAPIKTSAPATVSTTTLTVQASVAGVVSLPAEPLEKQRTIRDTNIAWEFAREKDALYTCELHDDGIVSFNLDHQLIEMLHDGDFSSLCIDPAGVMKPDVGAGEIRDWLREIAADVRQKKQAKIQAKENQAREASEKIELDKLISEHQSLFVIAHEAERKISALPKKDIGELKNIARELVSDLSLIGWSLSISAFAIVLKKEGQEIIRVSKGFFSLYHQQAGAELSGAQRRLHHVIGENFQSVIEILYLGNIGIQRTLISQMKARRKEIVIYEEQLKKGKGRLIVLPSEYHSKTQSGFPAEGYPLIIDNISLKSIDSEISRLKIKYPGCIIECCIIKDAVTLNGVASSLDALEIMNSPRALHILKKRISITYQIIQDPQDMNRSVIEYPKTPPLNGKHSARSALDQLTVTLGQLKFEDINDVFLKDYLQELHDNGIKVGYSMPVTLTKETLEQGMSTTKTPTAD